MLLEETAWKRIHELLYPSGSESSNKLKNNREFHEVKDEKDEDLLYLDYLEYFHETFNLTGIHPLFVDHSGF
ncbi:3385_t:CDS:2, partial [Racocetra persica]